MDMTETAGSEEENLQQAQGNEAFPQEPEEISQGETPEGLAGEEPEEEGSGQQEEESLQEKIEETRKNYLKLLKQRGRETSGKAAKVPKAAENQEGNAQKLRGEITKRIEEQMRRISSMSPKLKKAEDLRALPEYPQLCRMVERGYELSDAYKLLHFEELAKQRNLAAGQAALNRLNSKSHMTQTFGRGMGAVTVPAAIKEQYRILNPDATDQEIQVHYNKAIRKNKR